MSNQPTNKNPYTGMHLPHLVEMHETAQAELAVVKATVSQIEEAMHESVLSAVTEKRLQTKKTEGTVHTVVEDTEVTSVIPKRISWDADCLKAAMEAVKDLGYVLSDWFDVKYSVNERVYQKMPADLKKEVDKARIMKHGKEVLSYKPMEHAKK